MLIQFVQNDTFRVRFNPKKLDENYTRQNTRSVVRDNFADLKRGAQQGDEQFYIDYQDKGGHGCVLTTKKQQNNEAVMKVVITKDTFKIEALNCEPDGSDLKVW